jgi:hypothetical protein
MTLFNTQKILETREVRKAERLVTGEPKRSLLSRGAPSQHERDKATIARQAAEISQLRKFISGRLKKLEARANTTDERLDTQEQWNAECELDFRALEETVKPSGEPGCAALNHPGYPCGVYCQATGKNSE